MIQHVLKIILLFLFPIAVGAQNKLKIENEIRLLEQLAVDARLAEDSNMLRQLWAPELIVTTPGNKIVEGKVAAIQNQKKNNLNYTSFERIVEKIQVQKNFVITMGYEVFTTREDHPEFKAGETVKRRFTNIWMHRKGKWLQVARHGSYICSSL